MSEFQIEEMMEAGAHFGHQTKRWNPKMRPFLYGARSGVHIIDLQKTKDLAKEAADFLRGIVAQGKDVLFVGTKPQAREIMKNHASRSSMYYVTDRWMGGTLTNFSTIKKSIDRLIDLETRREKNDFEGYTKKEILDINRTIEKLEASLGGIKAMSELPGVLFVVDPKQEYIAVQEANKLNIPVIALTDSNCDPDPIDYVIPANDDAISSVEYFTAKLADICIEACGKRELIARDTSDSRPAKRDTRRRPPRRDGKGGDAANKSYVSRAVKEQTYEGDATEGFSATADAAAEQKPAE